MHILFSVCDAFLNLFTNCINRQLVKYYNIIRQAMKKLKTFINPILSDLLADKAMISIEIVTAILNKKPNLNKNTIKSFVRRSEILYKSTIKYGHCEFAYILKKNKKRSDLLFNELSDKNSEMLGFINQFLNKSDSHISDYTFAKLLCIDKEDEIKQKLLLLTTLNSSTYRTNKYIYRGYNNHSKETEFKKKQNIRLLAYKILLYKQSENNLINISRNEYLGLTKDELITPSSLYGKNVVIR